MAKTQAIWFYIERRENINVGYVNSNRYQSTSEQAWHHNTWHTHTKSCLIIDVAVPVDKNSVKKIAEKITKYRDLKIEIQKCWGLKKVKTVPIVIGALGTVCSGLTENLNLVSPQARLNIVQKTALLGTAHILRNVLTSNKN